MENKLLTTAEPARLFSFQEYLGCSRAWVHKISPMDQVTKGCVAMACPHCRAKLSRRLQPVLRTHRLPGLTRAFLSMVTLTTGCGVLANRPIFLGFLCECSPGAASPFSSTKNNVWNWRPG